uniref:Uncharacterized protein n=1 Tax=Oryza rufipogon TaxID=4529 RepID=A0A0E0MVU5_ORYRU
MDSASNSRSDAAPLDRRGLALISRVRTRQRHPMQITCYVHGCCPGQKFCTGKRTPFGAFSFERFRPMRRDRKEGHRHTNT